MWRTCPPASTEALASRAISSGVEGTAGCSAAVRWPFSATSSSGTCELGRGHRGGSFGPTVLDRVAERARNRQQAFEIEVDPGPGLLRHLVLDRQVEVVGPVVEGPERVLVLCQHR